MEMNVEVGMNCCIAGWRRMEAEVATGGPCLVGAAKAPMAMSTMCSFSQRHSVSADYKCGQHPRLT